MLRGAPVAQTREAQHESEHVGLRELGVGAQASVQRIECMDHLQGDLGRDVAGYVRVAGEVRGNQVEAASRCAPLSKGGLAVGGVGGCRRVERQQGRAVDLEELAYALQRLQHLVDRDVGGPADDVSAGGQKGRRRPAAHVVAAVHVGVAVVVHADGDEVLVDDGDDARVGVAGLVHDVAPVAPHGGEREEDGAPEPASFRERGLAPGAPRDLARPVGTRGEAELGVAIHASDIPAEDGARTVGRGDVG